jgi:hypothetical protein
MGRSDAELLEASKRGERDAFGALIERYQDVICVVGGNQPAQNLREVIELALAD